MEEIYDFNIDDLDAFVNQRYDILGFDMNTDGRNVVAPDNNNDDRGEVGASGVGDHGGGTANNVQLMLNADMPNSEIVNEVTDGRDIERIRPINNMEQNMPDNSQGDRMCDIAYGLMEHDVQAMYNPPPNAIEIQAPNLAVEQNPAVAAARGPLDNSQEDKMCAKAYELMEQNVLELLEPPAIAEMGAAGNQEGDLTDQADQNAGIEGPSSYDLTDNDLLRAADEAEKNYHAITDNGGQEISMLMDFIDEANGEPYHDEDTDIFASIIDQLNFEDLNNVDIDFDILGNETQCSNIETAPEIMPAAECESMPPQPTVSYIFQLNLVHVFSSNS